MDSLTITTDCITLGSAIAKATWLLNAVVREVRESRSVLDNLSRELHSLESVLDLLQEDAESFPSELAIETPSVLERCHIVVEELDTHLSLLNQPRLSNHERRTLWVQGGKEESITLQKRIAAHRAVLGLGVDVVGATTIREIRLEGESGRPTTIQRRIDAADAFTDISRILNEMEDVHAQTKEVETYGVPSPLLRYIMTIKSHVAAVLTSAEIAEEEQQGAHLSGKELFPAYVGDGPDSAISVSEEPLRKTLQDALASKTAEMEDASSEASLDLHDLAMATMYLDQDCDKDDDASMIERMSVNEIIETISPPPIEDAPDFDEVFDKLGALPGRAPTPPPKDSKRLEASRNNMVSPFIDLERPETSTGDYGVFTEISSVTRKNSNATGGKLDKFLETHRRKLSDKAPKLRLNLKPNEEFRRDPQPETPTRPVSRSTWTGSSAENTPMEFRPSTPVIKASLVRRSSKRLSVSLKKLPLWSPTDLLEESATQDGYAQVFGVSLQKSMAVAKGTSKTHHGDNGGSSRRDFPLCMQKCTFFIKQHGIRTPHIFAEAGDSYRVRKLKEIFSTPPLYGSDFEWENCTVYDAADLILLYLSQLPKPLISESLAKRWVVLTRQSMVSGALANRLEQCIDFWEEALSGLRGPQVSLFKLLLNVWADIAEACDWNEMTAERLAASVVKPLLQINPEKYDTDYVLALAYLIRKRGEYIDIMKKDKKTSEIARVTAISRLQGW